MKGRKEHELKVANEIEFRLSKKPQFIKDYYKTLYSKSYTTQNVYIRTIEWFVDFLRKEYDFKLDSVDELNNVKPFMIDNYIQTLQDLSASSRRSRLYAIKSFFRYLEVNEYIISNPASKVDMPIDNDVHKIISLTKDEIATIQNNILNNCGNKTKEDEWLYRDYAIIMLALSMAFRVSSIIEINVDDIDFEERKITITQKGNKTLEFVFSSSLKEVLLKWIEYREEICNQRGFETDALFINRSGGRLTVRSVQRLTKKYTYNIDKKITPHKFRSTCATEMYKKTGDIYAVARKLGQSNIENTKRYIQYDRKMEERAASIMDDVLF